MLASIVAQLSLMSKVFPALLQSTIDMLSFWRDSKLAKQQGGTLLHPYNLGFKRNFQVTASLCLTLPQI